MHKEAIDFVSRNKNSPFFLYYASPIPHLPLQAPKNWVSYYEKKFGKESPYTGKSYYPNRTPRATYAAMISYLDEQVGDLVSKLKEIGIYDNTLIIFSSDNGPTWVDHVDYDFFNSTGKFTNSRRTMKGSLSEGGIRIPMIVSWPDKIKPGSKSNHISSFYDFFETACDIAGIENTHKTDGISFYNEIIGKDQIKHNYLYWEYPASGGLQAIRMGKWKAIRKNLFEEVSKIELYNLSVDEKELNDISKNHPELIKEFEVKFKESHSTPILKEFIIPNLEL
jgi:arylsulfatase